ncbi:MAG: hypothetical protein OJF51_003029 [Nitrospira sp.]|nr:MAG: hypothetical protein OJF51_003029 [Nitrospira sp.]
MVMCMDDEDGSISVLFFGGSEGRCRSAILIYAPILGPSVQSRSVGQQA